MAPTKLPITFRAVHLAQTPLTTTSPALASFPALPFFMVVTAEYEVSSPDGRVDGMFHADKNGVSYDGQQLFTGTIDGKKGSVAMRARGSHVGENSVTTWEFLPETATGQLEGISGTGAYKLFCGKDTDPMGVTAEGELLVEFE